MTFVALWGLSHYDVCRLWHLLPYDVCCLWRLMVCRLFVVVPKTFLHLDCSKGLEKNIANAWEPSVNLWKFVVKGHSGSKLKKLGNHVFFPKWSYVTLWPKYPISSHPKTRGQNSHGTVYLTCAFFQESCVWKCFHWQYFPIQVFCWHDGANRGNSWRHSSPVWVLYLLMIISSH